MYSIDEYSRRITPVRYQNGRHKFLLFLGCSFTYGEGVKDDQTLPYYTTEFSTEYFPYNYGFHGNGPFDILAKLETTDFAKEVKEKNGIVIYTFIDAHIRRTVGSTGVASWNSRRVYYQLTKDGKLVRKGSFESARPVLTRFYKILSKSRLLKSLKVEIPPRITDKDVQLTARVIEEMKHQVADKFPKSSFYVVIYPGSKYSSLLIRYLKEKDIRYLDYSKLFAGKKEKGQYVLSQEDKHPNPLAYQTLAKALARDLHLK
jgi:hypothetical protein